MGLTKIETTVKSDSARDAQNEAAWPTCKAPMVGTNPMRLSARRAELDHQNLGNSGRDQAEAWIAFPSMNAARHSRVTEQLLQIRPPLHGPEFEFGCHLQKQ